MDGKDQAHSFSNVHVPSKLEVAENTFIFKRHEKTAKSKNLRVSLLKCIDYRQDRPFGYKLKIFITIAFSF